MRRRPHGKPSRTTASRGTTLEPLEKVWLPPTKGLLHDEFVAMPGLGALYSRVSTYVFGNWNRCGEVMGLAPYGRLKDPPLATLSSGELEIPAWGAERSASLPWRRRRCLADVAPSGGVGGPGQARAGGHRANPDRARAPATRADGISEPLHRGGRGAQLRGEREDPRGDAVRERVRAACGRRRRHRARMRVLWTHGDRRAWSPRDRSRRRTSDAPMTRT